jgi:exodeoxyribonuclease VII large subunit
MAIPKEYLTVSELNDLIREVVNMGFPAPLWVCGEIQGYDRNREKKHVFFELCEKEPSAKDIVARIGLVIFAGRKEYIEGTLKSAENAFQLKDDIEVKFLCRVDFYPPHGAMRLIVEDIDPFYTIGKIAQEKQKLITLLKAKGTLDKNKEVPFPLVPLRIGLISAYDSAAYNDFLSELKISGLGFKVFFKNTLMQGKGAESQVCRAINEFNKMKNLDVIVITRGGGSIAELSCFDSQAIAESIAASRLPVLSGIGHEINITVTDLAAYAYQKTPTAIAGFLVERVEGFLTDLKEKASFLIHFAQDKVMEEKAKIRDTALDLEKLTNDFLKVHREHMVRLSELLKRQPLQILKTSLGGIDDRSARLFKGVKISVKDASQRLGHYEKVIAIASPTNTLKRGFSITRTKEGQVIRSVKEVKKKDSLLTQFADGRVESEIKSVKKGGDRWVI